MTAKLAGMGKCVRTDCSVLRHSVHESQGGACDIRASNAHAETFGLRQGGRCVRVGQLSDAEPLPKALISSCIKLGGGVYAPTILRNRAEFACALAVSIQRYVQASINPLDSPAENDVCRKWRNPDPTTYTEALTRCKQIAGNGHQSAAAAPYVTFNSNPPGSRMRSGWPIFKL